MQDIGLWHTRCRKELPAVHGARMKSLWAATRAAVSGGELWLTALGRHLPSAAKEKHAIKRVDRLLGNRSLLRELPSLYKWLATYIIGCSPRPVVLVDWSPLDDRDDLHLLRAAVAVRGRALPVAELVHERVGSPQPHERLLDRLKSALPGHCTPVLVTDAGFRGDWFAAVQRLGWYFVGRVRNRDQVRSVWGGEWRGNKVLRALASRVPKALSEYWLRKTAPGLLRFYAFGKPPKGRHKTTRKGERCRSAHSEKQARREREPWLLVSNLAPCAGLAKRVVKL